MKYGITELGFERKLLENIQEEMEKDINDLSPIELDLSDNSKLGRMIKEDAWREAEFWEEMENLYHSTFVEFAEGVQLDYLTPGVTRKAANHATGEITIIGDDDIKIPAGFLVSDQSLNYVFETTRQGVIENGKVTLPIIAWNAGPEYNLGEKVINTVYNPEVGIKEVYNEKETINGSRVETDYELRERFKRMFALGGSATREAVESAILNLDNVIDCFVDENIEMEEKLGIPPKSLAPLVVGGDDEEIAKTILRTKAGGIRSFGTTELTIEDSQGVPQVIGFSRATRKDIYVKINIERQEGYEGDVAVQDAVIDYIGGENSKGIKVKGLKLGEDVRFAKVVGAIMSVDGIANATVRMGFNDKTIGVYDLEIDKMEIAQTDIEKVIISYDNEG